MSHTKMQFCIIFTQTQRLDEVAAWYRACDAAGIHVGIPDSPALLREMYVTATVCAANTTQSRIITAVTNPLSRHPSVTAAALLSLNDLAPGRIALGIGTGDSAMWAVGLKPAPVARLRDYIVAVKALLRGEAATWEGKTFAPEWSAWAPPVDVPIYVACSGPKTLRMAAQVADGFIITMGFAPDDIRDVGRVIASGCAEVGRDPDALPIWWNCQVVFAPSVEEAMAVGIGWTTGWLTMGSLEGKGIPEAFKAPLLEMNADTHNLEAVYKTPDRGHMLVERAKRLGLYDWLVERSPRLWGTPDDVTRRLRELGDMGLTNWMFLHHSGGLLVGGPDAAKYEQIDTLAQQIMPHFA